MAPRPTQLDRPTLTRPDPAGFEATRDRAPEVVNPVLAWQAGELDTPGGNVVASRCGDNTCQPLATNAAWRAPVAQADRASVF